MVLPLLAALALIFTPAAAGANSHCTGKGIRAVIVSFTEAFNQGDGERLDALFATEPEFQWYSAPSPGKRLDRAAKRRDSLLAYFRARHARHDRLHLSAFSFNGNSPHWGNFDFTMRRSTGGFMGGRRFPQGGKGAAICDSSGARFIVFTFGQPNHRH